MNIHNINHNPCKSQHTTHYVVLEFLLTTTTTFEMTVCVSYKNPPQKYSRANKCYGFVSLPFYSGVSFLSERGKYIFFPTYFIGVSKLVRDGYLGSCPADPLFNSLL